MCVDAVSLRRFANRARQLSLNAKSSSKKHPVAPGLKNLVCLLRIFEISGRQSMYALGKFKRIESCKLVVNSLREISFPARRQTNTALLESSGAIPSHDSDKNSQ